MLKELGGLFLSMCTVFPPQSGAKGAETNRHLRPPLTLLHVLLQLHVLPFRSVISAQPSLIVAHITHQATHQGGRPIVNLDRPSLSHN